MKINIQKYITQKYIIQKYKRFFQTKKNKSKLLFAFTLFILSLLLLFYFFMYQKKELFENNTNEKEKNTNEKEKNTTIIIARYKEDISYLLNDEFNDYNIIIYNKGDNIKNEKIINKCKIIQLPNVGKCDHTYLYHIIQNYNNLPNVTIFLPASFYYMEQKKTNASKVMNKVKETNNSAFPVINYNRPVKKNKNLYNYVEKMYVTRFKDNQDNKYSKTVLSPIRPYGKWFEHHFPNNDCPYVTYMGIFAISKEDIHKNSIEKYRELISYVDKDLNPEASFFIERCWAPLFYPIDENKLITDVDFIW